MWGDWHLTIHGDVATWLVAAGTLALAGAAWRALAQLSEARTDRQVQVLMHLYESWNSELMAEALKIEAVLTKPELADVVTQAWTSKKRKDADEASRQLLVLLRIPDHFEALFVLMELSKLRAQIVGDIYKGIVLAEWDVWELAIQRLRDESIGGDRYAYTWFERLTERMQQVIDR